MAIVKTNSLIEGLRGRLGRGVILRTVRGKIIMSSKTDRILKQSPLQRENRSRFRLATAYAKAMMLDPEKKAFYQRKAKKQKLPNAYTAAITDYMRKPAIEVDTQNYQGEQGHTIKITATRNGFRTSAVKVFVKDQDSNIVEEGHAIDKDSNDNWIYKTTQALTLASATTMLVVVSFANRTIIREIPLREPPST